jgi:hypothetical protein
LHSNRRQRELKTNGKGGANQQHEGGAHPLKSRWLNVGAILN